MITSHLNWYPIEGLPSIYSVQCSSPGVTKKDLNGAIKAIRGSNVLNTERPQSYEVVTLGIPKGERRIITYYPTTYIDPKEGTVRKDDDVAVFFIRGKGSHIKEEYFIPRIHDSVFIKPVLAQTCDGRYASVAFEMLADRIPTTFGGPYYKTKGGTVFSVQENFSENLKKLAEVAAHDMGVLVSKIHSNEPLDVLRQLGPFSSFVPQRSTSVD